MAFLYSHFDAFMFLAQAKGPSDYWLTKWMTPIWFLGVGIGIGILALLLIVILFKLLSAVPFISDLSKGPAGHVISLAIAAGLTALTWGYCRSFFDVEEQMLVFIALMIMSAVIGWTLVFGCSRQAASVAFSTLGEGASGYIGLSVLVIMLVGLIFTPWIDQPMRAINSIPRLFETGERVYTQTIPGSQVPDQAPLAPIEFEVERGLLDSFAIHTNRSILLADASRIQDIQAPTRTIGAEETVSWNRKSKSKLPLPEQPDRKLHIQNREVDPATVRFTVVTVPQVPQAASILLTASIVFFVGLTILLQQAVAPRAAAVALATVKNELAQPLFIVLMIIGIVSIILFVFLSFNTFGEDIKLLKDCGITVIMLLAAFQGIWSASSSISEEIEGRTALTVLSKPIQRRSFVIGKFLGIFWVLVLMFVVLGAVELFAVAYKPIYEARETSNEAPTWQICHLEMMRTVPGLVLGLMQATVLSAISVALATRLPQLANIAVCFGVYVVGHLATALVSSTVAGFEIVKFVAQLVSTIVPILEHFSMQAAIDGERLITVSLLCATLVYCLLYVMLSMFLALLLFEDRDLA